MKIKKSLFGFVFMFLIGIFGVYAITSEFAFAEVKSPIFDATAYTDSVGSETEEPVETELKLKEYDYPEYMTPEDFKANGITIFAAELVGDGEIDFDKSEITIYYKRANGMTGGEYANAQEGTVYKSTSPNPDGVYTITYNIFDMQGNNLSAVYIVNVGDTVAPKISVPTGFVKNKFNISEGLSIDIADVSVVDNVTATEDCVLKVELVDVNNDENIVNCNIDGTKYSFEFSEIGTFKLTIEAMDAVGNRGVIVYYFDPITMVVMGEGDVELSELADLYLRGTKLSVEFVAKTGWQFDSFDGVTLDGENSFEVGENTVLSVVFKPRAISLSNEQIGVELVSTMNIVAEGSSIEAQNVVEGDQHFSQLKNLLSNPDKLAIYDITLKDSEGQDITELSDKVTLRIKLDEKFDVNKISVFRVDLTGDLTGDKVRYNFTVDEGYIVFETDHFSYYTISQSEGFKPVSPSKDGTNKMGLTLIILGVAGLVAVAVIAGFVLVKKKRN